jgi:tRNA A37 threonylcarbamoyladenosine dehydratase
MATANKTNPTMLEIKDIRETSYDPIAKRIRKEFKGTDKLFNVISSSERSLIKNELTTNAFVPSTAGILLAYYVVNSFMEEL